jgi:hypothetical protein
MAEPKNEELYFDVSSGLKTVLGSELITDDEVAIFELVKNSFDADASHVDLYFDSDQIVISDNGHGMTKGDVSAKWLRVGYSSKREQNRAPDFRDVAEKRRRFAGSKGVGRISSDRLGRWLTLQTRSKNEGSGPVHRIKVDWNLFDSDHNCPKHGTKPKGNAAFWNNKFARNKARDFLVTRALRAQGWRVLRIWEHELARKNEVRLLRRILRMLAQRFSHL